MRIKEIASARVRYGYRRIHVLLLREGWEINHKRVYRLYKEEGLNLRNKTKRKRISTPRAPEKGLACAINECWAMDFVSDQLYNGKRIRTLTVLDMYSRECLNIFVDKSIKGEAVASVLDLLKETRGLPKRIKVDNGPEFISRALDAWAYFNDVKLDYSLDYITSDITEAERNSTDPQTIQKCIHAGVLPACYSNTALGIELQTENKIGCFTRLEDNTVICPMGHKLSQVRYRESHGTRVYGNRDACRQCLNRCTRSHKPKFVEFGENTTNITARMYGSVPVKNPLPEDAELNPYNHVLDRRNQTPNKVMLTIRPDKEKLRERMCLSEHPFGTVKWCDGAHYVLCRGKETASGELGLSFLAYNLRRVLNILGTTALINAIEG